MAAKKKDEALDDLATKAIEKEIDKPTGYNPLLASLAENDKKHLFKSNVTTAFHKTGYPQIDYYFGSVINIHDKTGKLIGQEPRIGQAAGTFNLIIGASGSGKTTMAVQISANIIRQYPYANVIHYDCEERFDQTRCENITHLPASYFQANPVERYCIKQGMVGLDTIQEMIVKTYVNKVRDKEHMYIDSGFKDEFGKPVMIYQPTVIIIDSITTVLNETFSPDSNKDVKDAEAMRSNTEGARDAKTLKGFFKDVLPLCKEANIIIYGINHINQNMSMNAFLPVAKQQNFLKQDEIIPGGKTMIYYPYNIIKLTAKPSDDFTMEGDGFAGYMVMVEPIKSSSNQSGNNSKGISFNMVFSQKYGFDALRSMIMYGRDRGLIEGNRARLKFKDDPDTVFSMKTLYKDIHEKPIWEDINKYVTPTLKENLPFIDPTECEFDPRQFDY